MRSRRSGSTASFLQASHQKGDETPRTISDQITGVEVLDLIDLASKTRSESDFGSPAIISQIGTRSTDFPP